MARQTYTKAYPEWKDKPDKTTPILAESLNHIEQGIKDAMDDRALKEIYNDDSISCGRKLGSDKGSLSIAWGINNVASGEGSRAYGKDNIAGGTYSSAEGEDTKSFGRCAHAEGYQTQASGQYAHAEGYMSTAKGYSSHVEGSENAESEGMCNHIEGYKSNFSGSYNHIEGQENNGGGTGNHFEGKENQGGGDCNHIEGNGNGNSGSYNHIEGQENNGGGTGNHFEGKENQGGGDCNHIEGNGNGNSGSYNHIEGQKNAINSSYAIGNHVSGIGNSIYGGSCLTVIGGYNIANGGQYATILGRYNAADDEAINSVVVVGGGNADATGEDGQSIVVRKNILLVDWLGNVKVSGNVTSGNGTSLNGLKSELETVREIAEGASIAKIFDTKSDLDAWIAVEGNAETLKVGQNIYIAETDTPDYWWDGTGLQILETETVVIESLTYDETMEILNKEDSGVTA